MTAERTLLALAVAFGASAVPAANDNMPPSGFTALFNGKDLSGWKSGRDAAARDAHWKVDNGVIVYDGKGGNLVTEKEYADFILHVDWKIDKGGDSGIFLRGQPQVQIWDNKEGSGGIWDQGKKPSRMPTGRSANGTTLRSRWRRGSSACI